MAVEIDLVYEGQLRSRAVHGPSGAGLSIDAPVDNHGRGESFSPTDLVATALGGCALTLMGIVAEQHAIDLAGATAHVEKHMVADPHRRIGALRVAVHVPRAPGERERRLLVAAAEGCPVMRSLDPRIECTLEVRFGD